MLKRKSFFERLTSGINLDEDEFEGASNHTEDERPVKQKFAEREQAPMRNSQTSPTIEQEILHEEDAELSIDAYETPSDIVVQTMAAGVRPEDLTISITRDSLTIKGRREENRTITKDSYVVQELYWGSFSRTIPLPEEIDPEQSEAIEKHGLIIVKMPKINKNKQTSIKVKSI